MTMSARVDRWISRTRPVLARHSRFGYAYQNGCVKSATDWTSGAAGTVYWTGHTQDARGHVTKEVYGNNQITNLGFDQTNGRLYMIQTGAGGGTGTQNLSYSWDAVGNLSVDRI